MGENRDGTLRAFAERFIRSPVRWVVLVHGLLLGTLVAAMAVFPNQGVLRLLDASLVTAQIALLLIWMTLDGHRPPGVGRTLGVTSVIILMQAIHAIAIRDRSGMESLVCMVPCVFVMLGVLALPLSVAHSRGFRVVRLSCESMPPSRRLQFSIRSAMVAAVCVAVLFGLKGPWAALGKSPESIGLGIAGTVAIVVMVLVGCAIFLSIPLVAVWAVLTPGRMLPRLVTASVGWEMGGMLIFHYTQTGEGSLELAISAASTAGGTLILLATLFVLRQMGYRAVLIDRDGWVFLDDSEPSSPYKTPDPLVENGD